MKAEKLIQLLQQDKMLDEQTLVDLQDILKKYPFFQTARILWNYNLLCLKNQHTADNLKITAAYAGDRAKLFKLFHSITAPRYSSDPYEIKHTDASADLGTTTLPTNTVQETTAHEIAAADKKSQLAEEQEKTVVEAAETANETTQYAFRRSDRESSTDSEALQVAQTKEEASASATDKSMDLWEPETRNEVVQTEEENNSKTSVPEIEIVKETQVDNVGVLMATNEELSVKKLQSKTGNLDQFIVAPKTNKIYHSADDKKLIAKFSQSYNFRSKTVFMIDAPNHGNPMTDDDLEQFIKGQIDQIKTNPNPSQVHEEIQATDVSDEENKAEPIDHETIINNLIGNLRKAQDKARNEPEVEDEIDRLLSGRSRIEKQPEAYQSVLEQTTIVNTTTDTKTSSNDSTQIIQVDTPESVVQHQDIFDFSHKGIHTNDEPFIHEELEQEPTSDTQANIQEPTKYAETSLAPDIASFIDEFNNDFTSVPETIQVETPESVTQHEDIFDVTLEGIDLDEEPFIHDAFEHDELGQTEAYTQVDESAEYPMLDSANVSVQLVDFESHTISGALTQDQAAIDNMADESLEMETENTSEFENRVEASNDELFEMLGSDESDDFTSEQEPNDFPNTEISTNELDNSNVSQVSEIQEPASMIEKMNPTQHNEIVLETPSQQVAEPQAEESLADRIIRKTAEMKEKLIQSRLTVNDNPTESDEKKNLEPVREQRKEQLIEKFIVERPVLERPKLGDVFPEQEDIALSSIQENDEIVSEQLALLYSKQEHYDQSIAMFEKLSLRFPEKSAYFASQIEEIRKNINKE